MEEIVESGDWQRLVFLVNLSEHNWGRVLRVKNSLLVRLVIANFLDQVAGELA